MKTRVFNQISINFKNDTLTKSSTFTSKLRDEINYYNTIPANLRSLFPCLISYAKDYSCYEMEWIPYENLSEQILNSKIEYEEGKLIMDKLFTILDKIHSQRYLHKNRIDLSQFCIEKMLKRIEDLKLNTFFNDFLKCRCIYINNESFGNFIAIKQKFIAELLSLSNEEELATVIHGDFCFSNILYCPKTQDIKLIDPRGSFSKPGIYGHPLYDYAKLLHCLHGGYDYIVNHHFSFKEKENFHFQMNIHSSSLNQQLYLYFLQKLRARKINLQYLYLIEGSLFLSMASLHSENLEKQKVLFLKGLMILNDALTDKINSGMEVSNANMY